MSKGVVFVVVYSLVIVMLFCVFGYLITTVEPPPLVNDRKNDSRRFMDSDRKVIFLDDDLMVLGNAQYGLEKVERELGFRSKTDSYTLSTPDDIYENNIRIPSVSSNIKTTIWSSEPIFNMTNSASIVEATEKPKVLTNTINVFSIKRHRRAMSDDFGKKQHEKYNASASIVLKVFEN